MEKPVIQKKNIISLMESRFIKVYDLQYAPDRHYFDASRRSLDNLVAHKSDEDFQNMLPDAVSCFVILKVGEDAPKLLTSYEFRYPAGQFLLSPPAGLIDPEDAELKDPVLTAAVREIKEETGLDVKDTDRVFLVNPLLFSSPGMTDESNALACAVISVKDTDSLTQTGAVGSEKFDGFRLLTKEEAREILKSGRDEHGNFFSVYTWCALMYFVSGMWES